MTIREVIARAICRVQLNGGDPDQPAVRWNGTEIEPQSFPAWRDYMDEADAILSAIARLGLAATPIADIAAERQRQMAIEGWSPEHDDKHTDGSLARAASVYADPDPQMVTDGWPGGQKPRPVRWPLSWGFRWWKPKDRRRDLVRAGALIVAEIERLDRLSSLPKPGGE